jgi:hypothetical protein
MSFWHHNRKNTRSDPRLSLPPNLHTVSYITPAHSPVPTLRLTPRDRVGYCPVGTIDSMPTELYCSAMN